MKSRLSIHWSLFLFVALLGAAGSCFAKVKTVTENPVPFSKNHSFSDKNRENQAVEVYVLVLSLEENGVHINTLPLQNFESACGMLQQQAALYLSKAILPYYTYSKTIVPGLTRYKLLFPFHGFS
ncbi:MAG TPA: hypothetical protein ENH91_11420 [Leeuwenhoekiella sp.]|nr:hypothetical protein [Leeuwenhoekiella sp.]